jgi:hypothetical protein
MTVLILFGLMQVPSYTFIYISIGRSLRDLLKASVMSTSEQGSRSMKRNMKCFFIFMLLLLGVRTVYQLVVVFNPISSFFNIKDEGIFNLALIIPYLTEVVFNSVIFYYNFL